MIPTLHCSAGLQLKRISSNPWWFRSEFQVLLVGKAMEKWTQKSWNPISRSLRDTDFEEICCFFGTFLLRRKWSKSSMNQIFQNASSASGRQNRAKLPQGRWGNCGYKAQLCKGSFLKGTKSLYANLGKRTGAHLLYLSYISQSVAMATKRLNRSIEIRDFFFRGGTRMHICEWQQFGGAKVPPNARHVNSMLKSTWAEIIKEREEVNNSISIFQKGAKWRELQKVSNLIHFSIIHWGIKLPKVQLVKSLVAWFSMVIHGYQQGIHQKGCVFVPSAWSKWLSPHLWGSPQACTLWFHMRTLGQQWQTGNSTLVHNEYMYVYIYIEFVRSFLDPPDRTPSGCFAKWWSPACQIPDVQKRICLMETGRKNRRFINNHQSPSTHLYQFPPLMVPCMPCCLA